MREALQALNVMVERGVIPLYTIGGAIGASFYFDTHATEDLDVSRAANFPKVDCLP